MAIENEEQYRITLEALSDLKRSAKLARKLDASLEDEWLVEATREALQSEIDILQKEIEEFEETQIVKSGVAQQKNEGGE